ncbi:F0F1 ATP synthase subunit delta [uncultured Campylobacter sp.]|uniref:F0F1 ATP synthase subunit delta n=1 Tax=uncultured Campylobacter sp. TaxID=218934 RepID=UPI0026325BFB|nr:F0F1 ATP synthase subunit delta [uncultured Campylobacter sp.]
MNDLLAKRYAKAILSRNDSDEFYEFLSSVNTAFSLPKFKEILNSYELKKDKKLELILSFFKELKPSFVNFLKILTQNSRLYLIPFVLEELRKQKALKEQIYSGIVFSKNEVDSSKLLELEKALSKKFAVNIKLTNKLSKDSGVKISLDELGYEISFSMQNLQMKMSDYILKTM